MTLDHIKVGKFNFRIRALEDLFLPAYKGSTLRGGFGMALKRATCALRNQDCADCLLRKQCVYLYLFETPPPDDSEMMRLYPAAPHPFVIEPPEWNAEKISTGQCLDFQLVLIGKGLDYLPYFVYAFVCLGESGLGKGRGKFALEEVSAYGTAGMEVLYTMQGRTLKRVADYSDWAGMIQRSSKLSNLEELTMKFLTTARIKFNGSLVEKPQFHQLARSLLRRISALSYFHCDRRLDLDFAALVQEAMQIKTIYSDLHWLDWERYSTRQKQRMTLGGFIGTVTFRGNLHRFLPLLALGEVVHIGKAASFGLGKYILQPESNEWPAMANGVTHG